MNKRWLTKKDMHEARREFEIFNSRLKRGDVASPHNIKQQRHVVCGCGVEGCIFISTVREQKENKFPDAV